MELLRGKLKSVKARMTTEEAAIQGNDTRTADSDGPDSKEYEALRADLRAARRIMRRTRDMLSDPRLMTFRGQDAAASLLRDIEQELRGTV